MRYTLLFLATVGFLVCGTVAPLLTQAGPASFTRAADSSEMEPLVLAGVITEPILQLVFAIIPAFWFLLLLRKRRITANRARQTWPGRSARPWD